METIVQRLERLYKTDNLTSDDKRWLAEYLKGDISELYLLARDGFSKDVLEKKITLSDQASAEILKSIHLRIVSTPKRVFAIRQLLVKLNISSSIAACLCSGYVSSKHLYYWFDSG